MDSRKSRHSTWVRKTRHFFCVSVYIKMVVSASNRKLLRQRRKKATPPGGAISSRKPLAPVRKRRGGVRYADTAQRTSSENGAAILNAVRAQGRLEALHDQSKKTISNLEMRLGRAEATLKHKLDGHTIERDGDIRMQVPPTAPLDHDDDGTPKKATTPKPDINMEGAVPMAKSEPMGGVSTPKPGSKQQSARGITRPKSSMDVDSISPSDFIQKRPSDSSITQPTSRRSRVDDNQLTLYVTGRRKSDHTRENDDTPFDNKKQRSVGFGTQQESAITDTNKKMRAQPGGIVADPLTLPQSSIGIEPTPISLSRKQHATTESQFKQITDGEDDDLDI